MTAAAATLRAAAAMKIRSVCQTCVEAWAQCFLSGWFAAARNQKVWEVWLRRD